MRFIYFNYFYYTSNEHRVYKRVIYKFPSSVHRRQLDGHCNQEDVCTKATFLFESTKQNIVYMWP